MIRALNLILLAVTVTFCFGFYRSTHEAREREAELRKVEAQIADERRAIGVLQAEWTLLSQPRKIQSMAERHLTLQPMRATQIAYLSDLPGRAAPAQDLSELAALPYAEPEGEILTGADAPPLPQLKPAALLR